MKVGKAIAIAIFGSWVVAGVVYTAMRPGFKRGKELIHAAEVGDVAGARRLLSEGASVGVRDNESHTALWHAAYFNQPEIVEMLLAKGADPNARGQDGWTPLMWAVYNGNTEVVKVLLKHGANVNAVNLMGQTAVQLATTDHQKPAADLLRQAGAK